MVISMSEEQLQFEEPSNPPDLKEPLVHPDVSPEADAKLDRLLEIMPPIAARKLVKEFADLDNTGEETSENSDSKSRTWRKAYEPLRGEARRQAIRNLKQTVTGEADSEESN